VLLLLEEIVSPTFPDSYMITSPSSFRELDSSLKLYCARDQAREKEIRTSLRYCVRISPDTMVEFRAYCFQRVTLKRARAHAHVRPCTHVRVHLRMLQRPHIGYSRALKANAHAFVNTTLRLYDRLQTLPTSGSEENTSTRRYSN